MTKLLALGSPFSMAKAGAFRTMVFLPVLLVGKKSSPRSKSM